MKNIKDQAKQYSSPRSKRPDGMDEKRYSGWEDWPNKKWAWEFLRRHKPYILACKKACDAGESEKQAVAEKYSLKTFKDYREGYYGGIGKPVFLPGRITFKPNIENGMSNKEFRILKVMPGQVAVQFDLIQASKSAAALSKQLRVAGKVVRQQFELFKSANKKPSAQPISFRKSFFKEYIKILDCLNAGYTYCQTGKIVHPELAHKDDEYLVNRIKKNVPSARKCCKEYLAISTLEN